MNYTLRSAEFCIVKQQFKNIHVCILKEFLIDHLNIIAATLPRDCADWAAKGETLSGEFEVNIEGEY